MDRAGGTRYSMVLLFVTALAITMLAGGMLILMPTMWKIAAALFALIPIAITVAGIWSVLNAGKPGNITLLWIIIMILAPLLGPLLWFVWGRWNT